jgi:adenylate cyclase
MDEDLISFGPYSLDRRRRILRLDGIEVGLGGRAMDILCVLASERGEPVSKHVLLERVWPGLIIEENALQAQISNLRKTLGAAGKEHLVTIPGRGYRLLSDEATSVSPPASPPPAIVVLPFTNISGDPGQDYYADGMCEEITTALSRARSFHVIARNTAFTYKGRAVDIREVGRELGVRYVLEGSTRIAASRIRITVQLLDASGGYHLWADRFEEDLADVFALQDRVAESVVGAIEPRLWRAEVTRAVTKPTEHMDAYDLYLRALAQYHTSSRAGVEEAIRLLYTVLGIDPRYTLAKATLAWLHLYRETIGWGKAEDKGIAVGLAWEAMEEDRDDPRILSDTGHILSHFAVDHGQARAMLDRALRLNPNSVPVLNRAGFVYYHCGEPEVAIGLFERAMRLNPLDPEMGFVLGGCAGTHLMAGRDEEALALALRGMKEMPRWIPNYRYAIWALVRLGRLDEARHIVRHLQDAGEDQRLALQRRPQSLKRAFGDEYVAVLRLVGAAE